MTRKAAHADSLDLLLDTICNTFGGILFIALLIVILLQLNPQERLESAAEQTVSLEQVEQLGRELQGMHADLRRLRMLRRGQQEVLHSLVPASLGQLSQDHESTSRRRDQIKEEKEQWLAEVAEKAERIEQIRSDVARAESDVESAREDVAALRERAEQERAARRREARMPLVHSSRKRGGVGLVLQFGRLYVWHRYDRSGNRLGLNTEEFVILGEDSGGVRTTPRPTAGVVVDGSPGSHQAILAGLRRFSPAALSLTVVVRPDSYGAFRHLRAALIESRFEYRLMPTAEAERIRDRGGTDSRVQ